MQQKGFTLVEALVTIVILLIALAITIPQFTGSKKTVKNIPARDRLEQAYETVQDYYEGQQNPNGTGTYLGINAGAMKKIYANYNWVDATLTDTSWDSTANRALAAKQDAAGKYTIKIIAPSGLSDDQSVTLCNASEEYIYCVKDNGGPKYGASFGANAKMSTSINRTAAPNNCNTKISRAQYYAEKVDGNPPVTNPTCSSN